MNLQLIFQISPVASIIFLATVIVSLIAFRRPDLARKWMLHPYSLVRKKKYAQVLTSGFVHADWMHLIFNMVSFYFFALAINPGVPLEYLMTASAGPVGHLYFTLIYIGSMVFGDLSTIYQQKNNSDYYSLGASGAISGVLFSYILFSPESKIGFFFIPAVPAPLFAVLYVAFSIYAGRMRNTHINHDAHLWGGVFGFLLTIALFPGVLSHFLQECGRLLHFL